MNFSTRVLCTLKNETGIGTALRLEDGNGGAIHVAGTATSAFDGTEFRSNLANSSGGAVWNSAGSTMFLTDVLITGNFAGGNSFDEGGGGIFNNGGGVICQ